MSRNDLLTRLAAALLGIVALALAAATIDSPVSPGGSGGSGGGEGAGGVPARPPPPEEPVPIEFPAFLEYLVYAVAILGAIALAWYLIVHRREAVRAIALGCLLALVVLAVVYAITLFPAAGLDDTSEPIEPGLDDEADDPGLPGSGDAEAERVPFGPLLTVVAAVAAVFVGALLLSGRDADDDGLVSAARDAESESDPGVAAVGAAAGRAADRIDGAADVDNEVYRAWREMTDLLDVDRPETSTPGEFAAAAVDAGLARGHVEELTRLFEDVRYGHEETTAEMEARAVSVLERIEAEYADAGEDATGGGGERR
ncbi:DUF4129 domain-containing protein [Salinilacihabitans rarus]|uniref:DUF4129 domain-containing protein n=1 Tax=Salinilacihabitans rarus TaxID=2961596 RepID=UPI0020C9136E|nr:DUF4129 domain-containing protein [Salinilacihabitans rarus]